MNASPHDNQRTIGDARAGGAWTDLDLEAFHDGELDEADAEAVGRALRSDASLRARLAAVAGVDRAVGAAVHTMLDQDAAVPGSGAMDGDAGQERRSDRLAAWVGRLARPLAIAAGVALVGGAGLLVLALRGSTGHLATDPGAIASGDQSAAHADHEHAMPGVLSDARRRGLAITDGTGRGLDEPRAAFAQVVLSVPLRRARDAREGGESQSPSSVDEAIAVADPDEIARQMEAASQNERDEAYLAMGRALRSAMAATDYLDGLSSEEQVRVCRMWAEDPSLRPVVFARLAVLRDRSPGVRREVDLVAADLRSRSEFVPWLRSHGLI